jgi:hypothetical protein
MSLTDILVMLLSFVLGIVAAAFMFLRGILAPPRKSEADKAIEKLKVRIEAAKAERDAAAAVRAAEIKEQVAAEKKLDPVDVANDIITRN